MNRRPTASEINDDQLDALYARLERAEAAVRRIDAMASAWAERLPDVIRTAPAVDAIHLITRPTPAQLYGDTVTEPQPTQPLYLDHIESLAARAALPAMAAEIRLLRAELATARVQSLRGLADKADPQRPEISFFGDHGHIVGTWIRKQAEYEERRAAAEEAHVADDSSDPEHTDDCPGCEDTLPAWLYQRFANALDAPAWDTLDNDDRAYWEHQAAAVRRAVARGGFKTDPAAVSAAARP